MPLLAIPLNIWDFLEMSTLLGLYYSQVPNKRPWPNNRPGWKRDKKSIAVQGQINVHG